MIGADLPAEEYSLKVNTASGSFSLIVMTTLRNFPFCCAFCSSLAASCGLMPRRCISAAVSARISFSVFRMATGRGTDGGVCASSSGGFRRLLGSSRSHSELMLSASGCTLPLCGCW